METTFYPKSVIELITRSITEFSLHVGSNTSQRIEQRLPDIWVDEKKLFQYQTLDDGERQRYMQIYDRLSDPYEYVDDNVPVITTVIVDSTM